MRANIKIRTNTHRGKHWHTFIVYTRALNHRLDKHKTSQTQRYTHTQCKNNSAPTATFGVVTFPNLCSGAPFQKPANVFVNRGASECVRKEKESFYFSFDFLLSRTPIISGSCYLLCVNNCRPPFDSLRTLL